MNEKLEIVTMDGPAGSGKSTVAKETSQELGWDYIDTGAMYRAVCLQALRQSIDPQDEGTIVSLMKEFDLSMSYHDDDLVVKLNGEDISEKIRSNRVNQNVSDVAALPKVRKQLVKIQREMGQEGQVVMDGRDIGTVVFPDAKYKFYINAALEERARRRYNQLQNSGDTDVTLESVTQEIKKRDETDRGRDASPLQVPDDAHFIDTTHMTVEEVVKEVLDTIE